MALIDSREVCEILSISKSTLYRWCSISEDPIDTILSGGGDGLSTIKTLQSSVQKKLDEINKNNPHAVLSELRRIREDDVPYDFPRPFKIGRSFKWDKTEIFEWLKTKRV